MKNLKSQTGSTHVVVVIILIVAVLGLLGFVFWQNFIDKKPAGTAATTPSTSTSTTTPTPPTDPYSGWATYTNSGSGFSVRYPSNWVVDTSNSHNDPLLVATLTSPDINKEMNGSPDALAYDVSISSENLSGTSNGSNLFGITVRSVEKNGQDTSSYYTKKYTDTINGVTVTEYDALGQVPSFVADFTKGNLLIEFNYNYVPSKSALTDTLTKILNSFKEN